MTSSKFASVPGAIGPTTALRGGSKAARLSHDGAFSPVGAVNLYGYALAAPTIYIDPDGTFIFYGTAAAIVGAGATFSTGSGYDFSSGTWNSYVSPGWGVGFDIGAGGGAGFFTGS